MDSSYREHKLYIASYYGHADVVLKLLQKETNPNSIFNHGLTPLHAAAQKGHQEIVRMLLKYGSKDVESGKEKTDEILSTPLLAAAHGGHEEIVKLLLQNGADVQARFRLPSTSFFTKIEHLDFNKYQIVNNFNFNEKKQTFGYTSLHFAAASGKKRIVEMLLEFGANVNAVSKDNTTPLEIAILKSDEEIVKVLLEHGAFVNSVIKLVHLEQFATNQKIIRLLLEYGADENAKNEYSEPLLYRILRESESSWNIAREWVELLKIFLEHGSDVNGWSQEMGETILHRAVRSGKSNQVDMLLEYGADVNKRDSLGNTTYLNSLVKSRQHLQNYFSVSLFFNKDAKYDLRDTDIPYVSVTRSITKVIAKLEASKSYVCRENLEQIKTPLVEPYYTLCLKEIEKMKQIVITKRVTYFDILVGNENKVANYMRDKLIVKILYGYNLYDLFPLYAKFLETRIRRAMKRKVWLSKVEDCCLRLARKLRFNVPIPIIYKVSNYLNLADLKNLCRVYGPIQFNCLQED